MKVISIVDYGAGNLLSVARAFEHCGVRVELVSNSTDILNAKYLVLPGVGAFKHAINNLHKKDLMLPLKERAATGKPFLGICLGMQLLFDSSEEFGGCQGLGLIAGDVKAIPRENKGGKKHKIPHIGWNEIRRENPQRPEFEILPDDETLMPYYFVHSYRVVPKKRLNIAATCDYNGLEIVAVTQSENVIGCQFHPEKSSIQGLRFLKQFTGF